jgi:voltage-gated potassium channel
LKPDVLSFLDMVVDYKERAIELEEIRISDKSGYCDRPLSETAIARDRKLIVLSVKKHDGRHVFNPEPDTVLEAEDTVIAIGDREVLAGLA